MGTAGVNKDDRSGEVVVCRGVANNDGPGRPLPRPLVCVSGGRGQGAPGAVKKGSAKTAIGMGGEGE